jgi:prepilin-type N-terminal cleavage/methylation domain-containing protein
MKKGFTLIELLVVSTIIITLIGIGSVSYVRALKVSRDSRRQTDLEQIRQALETYRSEKGYYPTTATWQNSGILYPTYMTAIPSDPKSGYLYSYIRNTTTTYTLCAALEVTTTLAAGCTGSCGTGHTCSYAVNNP